MKDWNPNLYLKFENERTQPVKDLINRIELQEVNSIIDIGCGPGNSTEELRKRWQDTRILGIDSSKNMIDKAKQRNPDIQWMIEDANNSLSHLGKFDLVFSNAAIQWMPNHEKLLVDFFNMINKNGALAIQIPEVSQMAIQIAVENVAKNKRWINKFKGEPTILYNVAKYYDILCDLSDEVYLWETHYYHVMENHQCIIDWYKSTGMKPYLDKLDNNEEKEIFEKEVLQEIKKEYRIQKDGRVIFPFKRIFFIAYNKKI